MLARSSLTLLLALGLAGCLDGGRTKRSSDDDVPDVSAERSTALAGDGSVREKARGGRDADTDRAEPPTKPASHADRARPAGSPSNGKTGTGLRIIEGKARVTEAGFVTIPGILVNETGGWVDLPKIDVVLLDASGAPINVDSIAAADGRGETAIVDRYYLPPGEQAYFTYLRDVKKLARPYASHRLTASAFPNDGKTRVAAEGVSVTKDTDGHFEITGTLRNVGEKGCRSPKLVYGKFGADGLLLENGSVDADEYFQKMLTPGSTVGVKGKAFDFDRAVAKVEAYAACEDDYDN